MTQKEMKNLELLNEGRKIFSDASEYPDNIIIAYAKMIKSKWYFENITNLSISKIDTALNRLELKRQDILNLYFGLDGELPITLKEIAKDYNLSHSRIGQIKDDSLRKLKNRLRKQSR